MRNHPRLKVLCLSFLAIVTATQSHAQLSTNLQEWMRRINSAEFRGDGAPQGRGRGARAGAGQWVQGGDGYTSTARAAGGGNNVIRTDTATGQTSIWLSAEQMIPPQLGKPLESRDYSSAADGKVMMFAINPRTIMIRKTANDYWVHTKTDNSWRKLGGKVGGDLLYAKLSPDGTRAAYVRDNDIYVEDIRSGKIKQLTSNGSKYIINGTSDWVNEEEFSIRDAFEWSPDGKDIAYLQFDQSGVREFTLINYTDALYPAITHYPYPKPGQTNAAVRAGIVSASGGRTRWIQVPGNPRDNYIPRFDWADANTVILQHMDRLQQTNNIWLADSKKGGVKLMYRDIDKAWVNVNDNFVWLDDGKRLLYTSESDGWRHAYAISRDGDARLITTGNFDLVSISSVDKAGGWLYYIASPENATQRYLYRSRLDGTGRPERITPPGSPGTHTYNISPNAKWAFHTSSKFDAPGVSELISLPDHKTVRVFQDNAEMRAKVAPILEGRTEMFQVDVGNDTKLDGWMIHPMNFDPSKKYPLIVYVYGEPASTTVNDSWGGTGRLLLAGLADDGYIIASFDNSGTPSPKGREWRKRVYGSVGVLASKEQAAAVRGLAKSHPYIDLDRVGVYGWSGGGSMTLNLMFRSPELYKVGVSGAPVPDQTLYDSIYQERYMGLPETNAEGYKDGSPITHAAGLQGKLLLIHGTGDDNVHFQGTQRMVNKLIELNKQFSFMEYPNRRHGIGGEHIDTLRYGFIQEHLPAGGR
jgi:dipeptidyl-peptidase-4